MDTTDDAGKPQDGDAANAQDAQPKPQDGDGDKTGSGSGDDTFSREAMEKVRGEAASHRVKARDADSRAEKAEREAKEAREAAQAATKAREDAEKNLNTATIDSAVIAEAARLGFHDPKDATRLIERESIKLDGGDVVGVKDSVAALAKSSPHLLKDRGTADANAGGGGSAKGDDMNAILRRKTGRG